MKNIKGQSFFEVTIAMALISIVLVSLVGLAALSIKASIFARNQTEASRYSQQANEWIVGEKSASWTIFQSHTTVVDYCLTSLNWSHPGTCSSTNLISGTIFVRSIHFTNNADGSISSDVTTTWSDSNGKHSAPISTILSNLK